MNESKKLLERLVLLNKGRKHFLEFLRNLPVQSVLLACAFIMFRRLSVTGLAVSPGAALFGLVFLASCGIAFYANASTFYEQCFEELEVWRKTCVARFKASGAGNLRASYWLLKAIVHERFVEVAELAFVLFVIEMCVVVIAIQAATLSVGIWNAMHTGSPNVPAKVVAQSQVTQAPLRKP